MLQSAIDPLGSIERFAVEEYAAVVAAVRLITGDRDGAADSVQDAVVRYLERPSPDPVENLAAWVTVVASNRSRDRRRSAVAHERALARHGSPVMEWRHEPIDLDVIAALRSLPLRQRQVCVLHYFMDRSVSDVASVLGVSTGTVKTLLHRARRELAAQLGDLGSARPATPTAIPVH